MTLPTQSDSPADRFMSSFNAIEQHIRRIMDAENRDGFSHLVRMAEKQGLITRDVARALQAFSDLRNAIVHGEYHNGQPIADPREDVITDIRRLEEIITTDPAVIRILPRKDVVTFSPNDEARAALAAINDLGYPCFPVYDGEEFVFLLTNAALARWVARDVTDDGRLGGATIGDLEAFLGHADRVVFATKDLSAPAALSLLSRRDERGHAPTAIIVTEHGKRTQRPIRTVLPADIPALMEACQP